MDETEFRLLLMRVMIADERYCELKVRKGMLDPATLEVRQESSELVEELVDAFKER